MGNFKYFTLILTISFISLFRTWGNSQNVKSEASLLWEIKGKKVKSPSYLFGTMHMISEDKFYFPDHLAEKIKTTDILFLEIASLSDAQQMMEPLMLKEGNLFDLFTVEQLDTIGDFLQNHLHINLAQAKLMLGGFKPLALMQLIAQLNFEGNPKSYDLVIEQIALKNNISIKGFETVEEQVAIFDQMSTADQQEMIMEIIRDLEKSKQVTRKIEAHYESQHIDSLYLLVGENDSAFANYGDVFLGDRNKKWIPQIKKSIRKNATFIAVGAGHLGGAEGLIQLLIEEGFEVIPVKF